MSLLGINWRRRQSHIFTRTVDPKGTTDAGPGRSSYCAPKLRWNSVLANYTHRASWRLSSNAGLRAVAISMGLLLSACGAEDELAKCLNSNEQTILLKQMDLTSEAKR